MAVVAAGARTECERGRVADAARQGHAARSGVDELWMDDLLTQSLLFNPYMDIHY